MDAVMDLGEQGKHFTEQLAARFMREAAQGLAATHATGVLHRDIKPDNLLLSSKIGTDGSRVIVCDYGLAKCSGSRMAGIGTLHYTPPEVLDAGDRVDGGWTEAADAWSLGCVVYIMLVGLMPFYGDERQPRMVQDAQTKKAIRAGAFSRTVHAYASLSKGAKEIIEGLLTVDPVKRMTLPQFLAHPWVKDSAVPAPGPLTEATKGIHKIHARRKFKAAALAALFGCSINRVAQLNALVRATGKVFDADEVKAVQSRLMAKSSDGQVDEKQFAEVMAECGSEFTEKKAAAMFRVFDEDNSGTVSTREFVVGLAMLKSHGPSAIKLCFELLDADKSGSLDKDELGVLIRAAHEAVDAHALDRFEAKEERRAAEVSAAEGKETPAEAHGVETHHDREDEERLATFKNIASAIDALDVDHSGKVSFEEFEAGVQREPLLIDLFLHRGIRALTHDAAAAEDAEAVTAGEHGGEAATGGAGDATAKAAGSGTAAAAAAKSSGKECTVS